MREERDRFERLEEQLNDLTELHQHEVENIKSGKIFAPQTRVNPMKLFTRLFPSGLKIYDAKKDYIFIFYSSGAFLHEFYTSEELF